MQRTIKLKGVVDDNRSLSLKLPPETPAGNVDVIVLVDESRPLMDDGTWEELLDFHRKNSLSGLSLKELKEEGRR